MTNNLRSNDLLTFGNNVKNYRLLKGLTQEQLAESISISTVQLGRIESGKNACTIQMVLKLCAALLVTPNDLFYGINSIPSSNDVNASFNSFINTHDIHSKETRQFLKHILDYFPIKDIQSKDLINPHSPPMGDKPQRKKRRTKSVPIWKPERFEKFWAFYPRHEDRISAVREWDRLKPSDQLIDEIARALLWQTKTPDWPVPYACRYLKNQRWTDEPPKVKPQQGQGRPAARQMTGWHMEVIDGEEVMIPHGNR